LKSAIFHYSDEQAREAKQLIKILQDKGLSVATKILPVTQFYKAEESHQDYYQKHPNLSICHVRNKRFD